MKRIRNVVWLLFAGLLFGAIMMPRALAFDNTGWYWPVPDSLYMYRGYYSGHEAIDIISRRGVNENVVSARAGTVVAVYEGCSRWDGYGEYHGACNPVAHLTTGDKWGIRYYQQDGGTEVCNFGIGNGVIIDHGNGVWTEYSHMASINVRVGQYVTAAFPIGTMGSYGNSTGRHLHFAIKTNSYMSEGGYHHGTAVNSNPYGAEYIIQTTWNEIDNIWYSRDYASATKKSINVDATLDGVHSVNLGDFGSCDVYINGSLVSSAVNDYFAEWPAGTTYRITNITAADGYSYVGQAEYSGTVGTDKVEISLPFLSYGTLEISGVLDSETFDDISGLGTCDVYVDGELKAEGVSAFSGQYPQGTSYQIRNINAGEGKYYEGESTVSGVIGKGTNTVQLVFSTMLIPGAEWQEVNLLPSYISAASCEIQYKHSYTMTSETSPGPGWVQGAGTTTYTPTGGETESYYAVNETDTHRLVRYYYYHFCGPNAGTVANFDMRGNYVHYDAVNPGLVSVSWQGNDEDNVNVPAYTLTWNSNGSQVYCQSGSTCDGAYGSHGARSRAWYRMNVYQDYIKTTTYEWTREDSDWTDTLDSSATSVRYRFRLRDTHAPVIDAVEIVGVTQNGYTVMCRVRDDIGLAGVRLGTWKDSESVSEAKWQTVEGDSGAQSWEAMATICIADFDNERDCFYNTMVYATDMAGNETQYESRIRVFVPTVVHSRNQLILPADLKIIEESAFEGSTEIGEIVMQEGVEAIGSRAFADCPELRLVYLPGSVTEIAADAFAGSGHTVLYCPAGSAAERMAQENGWPYVTGE